MKKRIFIAINLPEKARNKLAEFQKDIEKKFVYSFDDCPIKWTRKNNLHITILFLGLVEDMEIPDLLKIAEEAIRELEIFDVNVENIVYGPDGKENPKMIWAKIEKTREIIDLQNRIQRGILNSGYDAEIDKKFVPHITLGRITQWKFRKIEKEEVPEVDEFVGMGFSVKSIEVMESYMKKGGFEYCVLKSINLK